MDFGQYIRALDEDPSTPTPEGLDPDKLVENRWIEACPGGYRPTDEARACTWLKLKRI